MRLLDDLRSSLRTCLETFPDGRRGANGQYGMADFWISAFSVFFMRSPSFLVSRLQIATELSRDHRRLFGLSQAAKGASFILA